MGARDAIAKLLTGIRAYHSSPHDFEQFDLSKIGTGEGAQAYGHGLYFSENPAVSGQGGQYWNQFSRRFEGPEKEAASYLKAQQFDRQKAIETLRTELADEAGKNYPDFARRQETLRLLESGAPVGPRTYEVNINADPAQMLDWDKPTYQQTDLLDALQRSRSPRVREVAKDERYLQPSVDVYGKDVGPFSGGNLYNGISFALTGTPTSAAATNAFNRVGAPGIKYLDEGSRGRAVDFATAEKHIAAGGNPIASADEWRAELARLQQNPLTSNYVVFDPTNIDIMKKYGVVGAPAGALTMGALAGQDQYQPDEVQP